MAEIILAFLLTFLIIYIIDGKRIKEVLDEKR